MMRWATAVAVGLLLAGGDVRAELAKGEVKAIAEEAAIYAFPMVMNYGTLYEYAVDTTSSQYKAPFNQISNTARVFTPKDTAIVTPNSDTPYSFIWFDLRAEPVVVTVPKVEGGRYFSVQLIDLYTHNFGYIGTRTTGNGGGSYLLAGPGWSGEKPAGVAGVIRCETEFALAGIRTQLFGPKDLENVKAVQAGYKVRPLSAFLGTPAPPAAPRVDWPKIDKALLAERPFAYLNFLLTFCPTTGTAAVEKPLREKFAKIGIVAGKPFSLEGLTDEQKVEFKEGAAAGLAKVKARVATLGSLHNGWRIGSAFGDRAFYKGDWTLRAAAAMAGIYGNNASEALYPMLVADSEGKTPDGHAKRYTLTFPKGQMPPANAFWSVTMYDAKTQLLIENPIGRYLVNSPMLPGLKTGADGSLTLYIQTDSPGAELESNWLPAPDGPIYLVMRIYWPKDAALDGSWSPPPVVSRP